MKFPTLMTRTGKKDDMTANLTLDRRAFRALKLTVALIRDSVQIHCRGIDYLFLPGLPKLTDFNL